METNFNRTFYLTRDKKNITILAHMQYKSYWGILQFLYNESLTIGMNFTFTVNLNSDAEFASDTLDLYSDLIKFTCDK